MLIYEVESCNSKKRKENEKEMLQNVKADVVGDNSNAQQCFGSASAHFGKGSSSSQKSERKSQAKTKNASSKKSSKPKSKKSSKSKKTTRRTHSKGTDVSNKSNRTQKRAKSTKSTKSKRTKSTEEIANAYEHLSHVDFGISVKSADIQSIYNSLTKQFMTNPRYYIHKNVNENSRHMSNDDAILLTSACFWLGFAPVTVSYNFTQISLLRAYLICKKCSGCKNMAMTCRFCAFSGNTEILSQTSKMIQTWISNLPFAPMNHHYVRNQMTLFIK